MLREKGSILNWICNKTIVITGATSGIGRELTKLFITKNGCKVIGVGRREEKFKELENELGDLASNFEYYLFDVSNMECWKDFAEKIADKGVSVIINNAGVLPKFSSFENASKVLEPKDYLSTMDTNFNSIVYSAYYMMPLIEKEEEPAFINIASSSALCPLAGTAIYSASKSAVKNFVEGLRLEKSYYISLICPGFTKTDIFRNQASEIKGIVGKVAMSQSRMSKKIYKGILRKKKRLVLGVDAKFMGFGYRWFPKTTPRLISKVLKASKNELFDDVFKKGGGND